MIGSYQLETLLGSVYRKGNIVFLPKSGDTVLSPVGNRITGFDLKNHAANTISVESSHNYVAMDISPSGRILIAGNEIGEVHVISLEAKKLLHLLKVSEPPVAIRFSPDGKHFAILKQNTVVIYEAPSALENTNPYYMKRVFSDFRDSPTSVDWSHDSKLISIGGKDNCIRVYPMEKYANFKPLTFTGHSDAIVNVFFEASNYDLFSLSKNGQLCSWKCTGNELLLFEPAKEDAEEVELSEDEIVDREILLTRKKKLGKRLDSEKEEAPSSTRIHYKKTARLYFSDLFKDQRRSDLTCSTFNKTTSVLVTGFANGMFALHQLPEFTVLQTLSLDEQSISTVSMNRSGDWIAFGCPNLGQLLVWEWVSETYTLKQQSHFDTMNVCEYSPDATNIATGGEDGKVKVWEADSSFCFVTFSQHTGSISGLAFTQNGKAILSSSVDGTVRAFDLVRYRNFRTFTSPTPAQFSCVSVDSSGEIVAAGSFNVFDIFTWSMKTGRLIQVLSKHTGPVGSLKFSPTPGSSQLASGSWDKTLRVWDILGDATPTVTLEFTSEVTCLAYKPDGKQIAVGTLDCTITFCSSEAPAEFGSIDGRNHMGGGRSDHDKITAQKSLQGKSFRCLAFSPDGSYILAGGPSKTICLYSAERHLLLRKFQITQNKSLDCMNEFVHHRKLTEFGNLDLLEERGEGDVVTLPGVRRGDMSSRSTKPEVRVSSLQFSPTGESWIATTTEGLLLYAQGSKKVFMPSDSDESVTPGSIRDAVAQGEYDKALILALRLNLPELSTEVIEKTPLSHVDALCSSIPYKFHVAFLELLNRGIGKSRHVDFYLIWCERFLDLHLLSWQKGKDARLLGVLTSIHKNVLRAADTTMATSNKYALEYLQNAGKLHLVK